MAILAAAAFLGVTPRRLAHLFEVLFLVVLHLRVQLGQAQHGGAEFLLQEAHPAPLLLALRLDGPQLRSRPVPRLGQRGHPAAQLGQAGARATQCERDGESKAGPGDHDAELCHAPAVGANPA